MSSEAIFIVSKLADLQKHPVRFTQNINSLCIRKTVNKPFVLHWLTVLYVCKREHQHTHPLNGISSPFSFYCVCFDLVFVIYSVQCFPYCSEYAWLFVN